MDIAGPVMMMTRITNEQVLCKLSGKLMKPFQALLFV